MKNARLFGMPRGGLGVGMALLLALSLAACTTETTRVTRSEDPTDAFDKAADRAPNSRTLYTMARILIGQGRNGEAEYILVRIIREDPTYVPAYVSLADIQLRDHKVDEAEKTLLTALAKAPNDPVVLNDLGMCQVGHARYKEALNYFNKAIMADPRSHRYAANRAMALGMQGMYDESLVAYLSVVSPAIAHYNVGVLSQARGDTDRAAQEFSTADELRAAEKKSGKKTDPAAEPPVQPVGSMKNVSDKKEANASDMQAMPEAAKTPGQVAAPVVTGNPEAMESRP